MTRSTNLVIIIQTNQYYMSKTFKTLSELDPRTVMVVDALNLAFRWKHSGDTDFLESYIRTIDSLRKS